MRATGADDGFTLVEVVVALMVFSLVSLGLLHSVISAVTTSEDSRNRLVASNIAATAVDSARADGRDNLEDVVSRSWTVVVDDTTYTVEQSATWVPGTGGTACGASGGSALLYKRVGVAVRWPDMGATPAVRSDTVVSPPAGTFDPGRGNLAVVALGRDASPVGYAQVRLSGPSNVTALTDDRGCAFFTSLPPGTYGIQVSKLDHVDVQGAAASTGQASAVAGQTVAYQATVDKQATVVVDGIQSPGGATVSPSEYPLATGSVLSLGNPAVQQGRRSVPVALGSSTSGIFPFESGYRTWLGSCADADPEATTVWAAGVTAPVVATDPGATGAAQARGAQVEVNVRVGGAPVTGATVRASHPSETGAGCNSGQTLVLGVTGVNGRVRATVPYGKGWTFSVNVTGAAGLPATRDINPNDTYPRVLS